MKKKIEIPMTGRMIMKIKMKTSAREKKKTKWAYNKTRFTRYNANISILLDFSLDRTTNVKLIWHKRQH